MRLFQTRNKEPLAPPFSWMSQDIHSHLLPGIDDGSPDVETSVDLIRRLHAAGLKTFICTPHIFGDMFRNTPETIHSALALLRKELEVQLPDVTISAAAEYMLDDYFMELLKAGNPLLTLKGNLLLTELPYTIAPSNVEEITFDIFNLGYQPVLAHPERYGYYYKNMGAYQRLKEIGFHFQLNLLSLTGYYGKRVKATAKMLLKADMIDFVGTDLHHFRHLEVLLSEKSQHIFQKYLGDRMFNELQ